MRFKIYRLVLQILGLLVLLAVTVFILSRWQTLPEEIPSNFGISGQADSFAPKSSLISMLAVAWVGYVLFTVLSYFPRFWNLPVRSPRAYRIAGYIMPVLGLVLALIFGWVGLCSALGRGLGAWFLPVTLAAVAAPVIILIVAGFRE